MSAVTFHPSTSEGRSHPHRNHQTHTKTHPTTTTKPTASSTATTTPITTAPPPHLVPRLDDLALHHLAANLHRHPAIDALPPHYLAPLLRLLEPLPPLPLPLAAAYITAPPYWQWRAERAEADDDGGGEGEGALDVRGYGGCYRRLVCERWLGGALEAWGAELHEKGRPKTEDAAAEADSEAQRAAYQRLLGDVRAVAPFIHTVRLRALPSHCDLSAVLRPCTRLTTLSATFGARRLAMDHDMRLVGMQGRDALYMARLLLAAPQLTVLRLPRNRMTDAHVGVLLRGLAHTHSLTTLDLSHNGVSDGGAALLAAHWVGGGCMLAALDLSDNAVGEAGGLALAAALRGVQGAGRTLSLQLSLNPIGTAGAAALLGAVADAPVVALGLGAVGAGGEAGEALVVAVRRGAVRGRLRELGVSGNALVRDTAKAEEAKEEAAVGVDGDRLGEQLLAAVRENKNLVVLDVSGCGFSTNVVQQVQQVLFARIEAEKAVQRKALEARRVL